MSLYALRRQLLALDGVSPRDAAVYCALQFFSGPRGCFPTHGTVAAHVKCSVRTVQRSLGALRRRGLVSWRRRDRRSCEYALLWTLHFEPSNEVEKSEVAQALEDVGVPVAADDPLPRQLEALAKRCGATPADMALFIADKGRKRPRGPGFYRVVAKQDFREWWAEVQQARDALAASPEPDSGWRMGGRACPHCGGPTETWVEDERYGRCRRCDRVENWRLAS